jgi:nicotinamidase-related amidase
MVNSAIITVSLLSVPLCAQDLHLTVRSRAQPFKNSQEWIAVDSPAVMPVKRTALIICDMWDNHWCKGAARRVDILARRMAPIIERARAAGIQIVHAPSETMEFYKEYPQRRAMLDLPKVDPPAPLALTAPPLPIDDSGGGCDTPDKFYKAWTRENSLIPIAPGDRISDNGAEIYSFLRRNNIDNLLVMGVHANFCILNRSFAIKQMTKWGMRCVLVRDLTDAMYNPEDRPKVSHERGTELVIEYIESYWAPTITSSQLLAALP